MIDNDFEGIARPKKPVEAKEEIDRKEPIQYL
jgi:hypothetical protein